MKDSIGNYWLPFMEAREFVHSLNLHNWSEWLDYTRGILTHLPPLPRNIPKSPMGVYKRSGWKSVKDWLRTNWREFSFAREFVQKLKLANYEEWLEYVSGRLPGIVRLPNDIPKSPQRVYKNNGWQGWGDWLRGHSIVDRWNAPTKRRRPRKKKSDYLSFETARSQVRKLGLNSSVEWNKYCNGKLSEYGDLPNDIPSAPHRSYRNSGWINYADWLGCESALRYRPTEKQSFEKARGFVRCLGLKSTKEWIDYTKGLKVELPPMPHNIPKAPNNSYKGKGWSGMPDWLGFGHPHGRWLQYEDALSFVKSLQLKSYSDWRKYIKGEIYNLPAKPLDIPSSPANVYRNKGWVSWFHWLGHESGRGSRRKFYRPFNEARNFARSLSLKSWKEWELYCKGTLKGKPEFPTDIPKDPKRPYKGNGWVSYTDWLGNVPRKGTNAEFRTYQGAREFVRQLGLRSGKEWSKYCKGESVKYPPKPNDIPSSPYQVYRNRGWISWYDWLGTSARK